MTPRDFALVRWCRWCGSPATWSGAHDDNGDFDPYSVLVSDAEIEASGSSHGRERIKNWRERARFNIAFGKHIGVYKLPDAAELEQLQRKSIRTVIALADAVRAGDFHRTATPFDEHHRALKRVAS